MILYLIQNANEPLTNTQITRFVLEKEYTNYFVLQQTLNQLLESGLITAESTENNTIYELSAKGQETLELFQDKISESIKDDIFVFLNTVGLYYDRESAGSSWQKKGDDRYDVTCIIRNRKRMLLETVISVSTEEQAEAICRNWDEKYLDVYTNIMDLLLQ